MVRYIEVHLVIDNSATSCILHKWKVIKSRSGRPDVDFSAKYEGIRRWMQEWAIGNWGIEDKDWKWKKDPTGFFHCVFCLTDNNYGNCLVIEQKSQGR